MARLIIQDEDFSSKLKDFSITCKECGGKNVTLDIDWACYPSCCFGGATLICEDCHKDETIYDW